MLNHCKKHIRGNTKAATPTTVKGCRSFAGMVNFLSMFFPELQKLLKPIYDINQERQTISLGKRTTRLLFEKIKYRLIRPPVLYMPNTTGRFHLYSDISMFATGSVLYQIQNGKPKLIAVCQQKIIRSCKKLFHY